MEVAHILLALVLSIPGIAVANTASIEPESWKRLVAEMKVLYGSQPALTRTITKKQIRLELCPDNTCVRMSASQRVSAEIVADFFYLFEFYAAPYHEQIRDWKPNKEVTGYAHGLLDKYRTSAKCQAVSESDIAHCVLRHLVKTQGIRLSVVRDDENKRVVSPVQIDEFFQNDNGPGSN